MPIVQFLNMGASEIMLIVMFVLIFFGSKSIPEFARTLGKGMREFRNASDAVKREISDSVNQVDVDIKNRRNSIEQEYRKTLDQIEDESPIPPPVKKNDDIS